MIRHPQYLELPWDIHWYPAVRKSRPPGGSSRSLSYWQC
jgi:hypothetical protein